MNDKSVGVEIGVAVRMGDGATVNISIGESSVGVDGGREPARQAKMESAASAKKIKNFTRLIFSAAEYF